MTLNSANDGLSTGWVFAALGNTAEGNEAMSLIDLPFTSAEPLKGRQAGKWAGTCAENQSKGLTFLPLQKNCKAVGHIIDFRS